MAKSKYVKKSLWHEHIREARMSLGDAIRTAHDALDKQMLYVERGLRWEQEEVLTALDAASDLGFVASAVDTSVAALMSERTSMSASEKTRLRDARTFLKKGAKLLDSIDGAAMVKLAHKWEDEGLELEKAHEAYFLQRFGAGMRVLRLAWNKLFYATQMPSVRRIVLNVAESSAYYDPMSDVRKAVHAQAEELANRSDKYVEVYDADNDMVFVAQPVGAGAEQKAELTRATQRARPRKPRTPVRMAKNERSFFRRIWEYRY